MKYGYISYEPCFIDGVYVTDQRKLKEFYEEKARIEKLAKEETDQLKRELEEIQPIEYQQQNNNPMKQSTYEIIRATAPYLFDSLSEDSLNTIIAQHRQQLKERERSTEWGRLVQDDPEELQRLMKDEPDRYEAMANFHAVMMRAAHLPVMKDTPDIDEQYLKNFLSSLKLSFSDIGNTLGKIASSLQGREGNTVHSLIDTVRTQQENIDKVLENKWSV